MKLFDHIERLNGLNELIEHKRTGIPEELAHCAIHDKQNTAY